MRPQKDDSRTLAFALGSIVAVTTDRWSALVNVTVRVLSEVCEVLVLKPRLGTAEIRHTPRLPYRTVTFPPWEGTVYRPAPPSSQSTFLGAGVLGAPVVALTGVGAAAVGEGLCDAVGEGPADAVGDGVSADGLPACQAGGVSTTVGADRATGGVCRVEPTTNWTVASTAVTLAAVHDSHMSR
ncbi:hypothetical protein [Streptomyces sp. NRRL F-4474]|uniref:hypothetical protein n=1 Tax=Streptomyces sp. NRRL F-4474 TaxID=1463851 RepID=UPI000A8DD11E|nr:hypothetical protein [Streptomyces sp. NRRL F-4474]